MGEVHIEPMLPIDAVRCAEIEAVLFAGDSPWPLGAFRAELAASHTRYFVAKSETGRVIGYAGLALLGTPREWEAEIHTVAVDPARQREGIGQALLDALLTVADEHAAPLFLEVRDDNIAARELYRRNGFAELGVRRGYYPQSGRDAITMRRETGTPAGPGHGAEQSHAEQSQAEEGAR